MAFHKLHRLAVSAVTVLESSTACKRTFYLPLLAEHLPWKLIWLWETWWPYSDSFGESTCEVKQETNSTHSIMIRVSAYINEV
jgi:hypothetical protein